MFDERENEGRKYTAAHLQANKLVQRQFRQVELSSMSLFKPLHFDL